ncbi:MAG: hypothetical protein FWC91_04170 [Defluviitaleaceae bacterium]|nr:hypothetical protein [Defluviitaleaceae bacterium]
MDQQTFEGIKQSFKEADLDTKIDMYATVEGLSHSQYKELLKMFPLNALDRLEAALA